MELILTTNQGSVVSRVYDAEGYLRNSLTFETIIDSLHRDIEAALEDDTYILDEHERSHLRRPFSRSRD